MGKSALWASSVVLVASAVACSAADDGGKTAGPSVAGGASSGGGESATGGGAGLNGFGGSRSSSLGVHVETPEKLVVDTIMLNCDGRCADLRAVPRGGNPPYALAWEDGTTAETRRVCLDSSQTLAVTAKDTPRQGGEFPYAGQTAVANVTANVIGCAADGGSPAGDSGARPPGTFCVDNPSFEGGTPGDLVLTVPQWTACEDTADVGPAEGWLPASDGQTYVGGASHVLNESAGGTFCEPLEPGALTSFEVDLALSVSTPAHMRLELWGGMTSCGLDELLWRSPEITNVTEWKTHCGTFQASRPYPYLRLVPTGGGGLACLGFNPPPECSTQNYVISDNLRAAERCE